MDYRFGWEKKDLQNKLSGIDLISVYLGCCRER